MLDKLTSIEHRYTELASLLAEPAVQGDPSEYRKHARALAEIEQGLYEDDPRLAHRFDAWSVPNDWRRLAVLLIAVGIVVTVAGTLALSGATIVLLGFFPVAAGIALWYLGES